MPKPTQAARLTVRTVGNRQAITVPRAIAEVVPEDQEFVAELTEDGILYRAVDPEVMVPLELPAWAKQEGA